MFINNYNVLEIIECINNKIYRANYLNEHILLLVYENKHRPQNYLK